MKTLHLNLKRQWFDMIQCGEKIEEYRELTNYWLKRFCDMYITDSNTGEKLNKEMTYDCLSQNIDIFNQILSENRKNFSSVTFTNGYNVGAPTIKLYLTGIEISEGHPNWGAIPNKKYFVLKLGPIKN